MGLWNSFVGAVRIRITSASIEMTLNQISADGIPLKNTVYVDDLTVETTVLRYHYKRLVKLLQSRGNTVKILEKKGIYWDLVSLRFRPVLVAGVLIYVLLAVFLPTRIFFVRVSGNNIVSTDTIISKAEDIGIRFGAPRRTVRSESVKNALLSAVPELQWAGVNTYGCVAAISVQERTQSQKTDQNSGITSVVAKCDGIIQEVTATKGNVLCKVGDAVKKGQVLISGYTDCGITIMATGAEGEIYAQTRHACHAVSPLQRQFRKKKRSETVKYSFKIGKKLIKLQNDSGISDTTCVKIYREYDLVLPGGFQLPFSVVKETEIYYDMEDKNLQEEQVGRWTQEQSRNYRKDDMLAGQILAEHISTEVTEDALLVIGQYYCHEMIGQIYYEEIIKENG